MSIALKGLSGPYNGQIYPLHHGFKIGRAQGDLVIQDAKVSSQHAYVDVKEDGVLLLVDQRSKNGLKVNGQRQDIIELQPGLQIEIGRELFEVIDVATADVPDEPHARLWNDIVARFGRKALPLIENQPRQLQPLTPAVVLDFIRGPQIDTRWTLGFGPRVAGSASPDLPIYQNEAPESCFEIFQSAGGIQFKTSHPNIVKLNGKSLAAELLRVGDVIQIYDTEIEVDFIE